MKTLEFNESILDQIIADSETTLQSQLTELEQAPENYINSVCSVSYDEMTSEQRESVLGKIKAAILEAASPSDVLTVCKEEIVDVTIERLPQALSGDRANRSFYYEINEDGAIKVDYLYYLGQQQLSDRVFYTIPDHETPDPEEFGYDSIEEMDFEACGYREFIEGDIEQHVLNLEAEAENQL